jgi:hypothetical protein
LVELPGHYLWSSFHHSSGKRKIKFIQSHALYNLLGSYDEERHRAYLSLFEDCIDREDITHIREAWRSGTPLGNDRFRVMIEQLLNRKVGYVKRGRPPKKRMNVVKAPLPLNQLQLNTK